MVFSYSHYSAKSVYIPEKQKALYPKASVLLHGFPQFDFQVAPLPCLRLLRLSHLRSRGCLPSPCGIGFFPLLPVRFPGILLRLEQLLLQVLLDTVHDCIVAQKKALRRVLVCLWCN